jgi:hypothetical protein
MCPVDSKVSIAAFPIYRADQAIYSGTYQGFPVIIGQATDNFLCACQHEKTYEAIVEAF